MAYTLPELGYAYDALEPHIDARTMEIHHSKHHNAYVTNLNAALEGQDELLELPICQLVQQLDKVPAAKQAAVRNNGGGHLNHSFFWKVIAPGGASAPSGKLAAAIDASFGSFDEFKKAFAAAGATRFGSGWAWLCVKKDGVLPPAPPLTKTTHSWVKSPALQTAASLFLASTSGSTLTTSTTKTAALTTSLHSSAL